MDPRTSIYFASSHSALRHSPPMSLTLFMEKFASSSAIISLANALVWCSFLDDWTPLHSCAPILEPCVRHMQQIGRRNFRQDLADTPAPLAFQRTITRQQLSPAEVSALFRRCRIDASADILKLWRTACLQNRDVCLGPAMSHQDAGRNTEARNVIMRAIRYAADDETDDAEYEDDDDEMFFAALEQGLFNERMLEKMFNASILRKSHRKDKAIPDDAQTVQEALELQFYNCVQYEEPLQKRVLEMAIAHDARSAVPEDAADELLQPLMKLILQVADVNPTATQAELDQAQNAIKDFLNDRIPDKDHLRRTIMRIVLATTFSGNTIMHAICEHGGQHAADAITLIFDLLQPVEDARGLMLLAPRHCDTHERPLHVSARLGDAKALSALLNNITTAEDARAVHAALLMVTRDNSDYAQGDWAVNSRNKTKDQNQKIESRHRSPLALACLSGSDEAVEVILHAAQTVSQFLSEDEMPPAKRRKRESSSNHLLQRLLTQRDNSGADALCMACDNLEGDGPHPDIIQRLLKVGARVKNDDPPDMLPDELRKHDDDDDDDDEEEEDGGDGANDDNDKVQPKTYVQPYVSGAFHNAARLGQTKVAKLLLTNEPDLCNLRLRTADGGLGPTPLMLAARRGCAPIVEALLEAGADVSHAAGDGKTALDVARANGARCAAVVAILERNTL